MKPARLTSSLLTRKGVAAPSAPPPSRVNMVKSMQSRTERPPKALLPEAPSSAALRKQTPSPAKLSDWIAPEKGGSATVAPASEARPPTEKRVRVSLRLDRDRHLRLRLVATHLNRTLQWIFTQAIDEYFERHNPDVLDSVALLRIHERAEAKGNEIRHESSGDRGTERNDGPLRS